MKALEPSNSLVIVIRFEIAFTKKLSSGVGSSSQCLNNPKPVQINIAPKITNVKLNAASAAAPTAINIALRTRANKTPIINTFW